MPGWRWGAPATRAARLGWSHTAGTSSIPEGSMSGPSPATLISPHRRPAQQRELQISSLGMLQPSLQVDWKHYNHHTSSSDIRDWSYFYGQCEGSTFMFPRNSVHFRWPAKPSLPVSLTLGSLSAWNLNLQQTQQSQHARSEVLNFHHWCLISMFFL